MRSNKEQELLLGTLDMLILRTLVMGPAHGHTIAQVIEHTSDDFGRLNRDRCTWLYTGSRAEDGLPAVGA